MRDAHLKTSEEMWTRYYLMAGRRALASRVPEKSYFESGRKELAAMLEMAGATLDERSHVLEIGCGDGRIARSLAASAGQLWALDISPAILDACRQNLAPYASTIFLSGGPEALAPVPDQGVDFVLSVTVFQHIPDKATIRRYLEEIARILRDDGTAVLQFRNPARWVRVRDFGLDLTRLGTRLPRFDPTWRGCRVTTAEATDEIAATSANLHVTWQPAGLHLWMIVRRTAGHEEHS